MFLKFYGLNLRTQIVIDFGHPKNIKELSKISIYLIEPPRVIKRIRVYVKRKI